MELKTFITSALDQIIEGVQEAQKKHNNAQIGGQIKVGAEKNPSFVYMEGGYVASVIEFDIAVTASSEAKADASAKLSIFSMGGAQSGVGGSQSNESSNRIKFAVPMSFRK